MDKLLKLLERFRSIPSFLNNWLQGFQFSPHPQLMYELRILNAFRSHPFYLTSAMRKEIKVILKLETSQSLRKHELSAFYKKLELGKLSFPVTVKVTAWHCCQKGHLRKPDWASRSQVLRGKKIQPKQTTKQNPATPRIGKWRRN